MRNSMSKFIPTFVIPTLDLARKLIAEQFPEYASLPIVDVEKQGHDNRTYRLGDHMLIRMPTAADYALKVRSLASVCHSRAGGNPKQCKRHRK
jgi:aminoglycoside phosphotransferase (APT) family kinase protein